MQLKDGIPVHVALVVRDVERAVRFYRDVLGMVEMKQVSVPDEKAHRGGFSECGFEFRTFFLGQLAIKLVRVKTQPASARGGVDAFTGFRYVGLVVDQLDETVQRLREAGVEFLSEVLAPEPEHNVGRLVFFRDPEGNLIELYGV
jgi:catechol 2,3-dioxygenase-like lactoylglutathione lyase family enzyme